MLFFKLFSGHCKVHEGNYTKVTNAVFAKCYECRTMQLISPTETVSAKDDQSEGRDGLHRYLPPSCLSSSTCSSNNDVFYELDHLNTESDTDIEYIKGDVTLVDDIDASIRQPNNEAEQMLLQVVGVLRTEEVCFMIHLCTELHIYCSLKHISSHCFLLLSLFSPENASIPKSTGRPEFPCCIG